jgi:uncharacterized protein (TIGR02145 family)
MKSNRILNNTMETRDHSKNGASLKSHTSRGIFLVAMAIMTLFSSYCFSQTVTVQQNQQNVNINLPVIEKTVYVDKYRVVYVDKPQPKRVARKLSAPIQLLGYLWVYPEDLGNFKQPPLGVIGSVNAQNPYGRDNWRIPTPDELAVLENNADKVGLGDDIYLATDHSNGVLRLVSTGPTNAQASAEKQSKKQAAITSGKGVEINGVVWATGNVGAGGFVSAVADGYYYTWESAQTACPDGWRLPTKPELEDLMSHRGVVTSIAMNFGRGDNMLSLPYSGLQGANGRNAERGQIGRYWSCWYRGVKTNDDGIMTYKGGYGYFLMINKNGQLGVVEDDVELRQSCRCVLNDK